MINRHFIETKKKHLFVYYPNLQIELENLQESSVLLTYHYRPPDRQCITLWRCDHTRHLQTNAESQRQLDRLPAVIRHLSNATTYFRSPRSPTIPTRLR
nr:hypothetical protein FVER53263_20118 [Fusarium verticillioides]